MPGAPSSFLVTSSDALVASSFLLLVGEEDSLVMFHSLGGLCLSTSLCRPGLLRRFRTEIPASVRCAGDSRWHAEPGRPSR